MVIWPKWVNQGARKTSENIFPHRVINRWNALDGETVSFSSINVFKNKLNKIGRTRIITYCETVLWDYNFKSRLSGTVGTSKAHGYCLSRYCQKAVIGITEYLRNCRHAVNAITEELTTSWQVLLGRTHNPKTMRPIRYRSSCAGEDIKNLYTYIWRVLVCWRQRTGWLHGVCCMDAAAGGHSERR